MYTVKLTRQAVKDQQLLGPAGLSRRAKAIIDLLKSDPYQSPPSFEKLVGDLDGLYSRRLNRQHRIVYQVREAERVVVILRMWTHYE